jgi:phosphotransferase system enzyme I (PtsI)
VSSILARRGLAASPGIAIGPAFVLRRERMVIPERRITPQEVEGELARLRNAFRETRARLEQIRAGMQDTGLLGDVFDAQFLFLEDPTLAEYAERNIRDLHINAEWALQRELRRLEALFEGVADAYLRERAGDVGYVVRRVQQVLMGREPVGLGNAPAGCVVVAEELGPGEIAQIPRDHVAGIVTESGSRTSHVAIMARSLGIPAVVGMGDGLIDEIADGSVLIVDGRNGRVLVDAGEAAVAEYRKEVERIDQLERELLRYVDLPAETRDGVRVSMLANIETADEIAEALSHGAEGIGLFRTEFLYMNRTDLPSEEEQVQAYRRVLSAAAPREVVIRTLDLGGDKVPSGLDLAEESNPALGLRGIRMYIGHLPVFRTQLRALLRASPAGSLKILLPMVSCLAEFEFARRTLDEVRRELEAEGHELAPRVPLGAMIETPAAAMICDLLAPQVDFLSIGTNDLLQYTLAVDRTNEHVAYLYEPLHPAHLRMIQQISQAARRTGIMVGMCGEMASDPLHCWILMALGIGELSMAPFAIPRLKKLLRDSTAAEARALLAEILRLGSAQEIRERVEARMRARFPLEFERNAGDG